MQRQRNACGAVFPCAGIYALWLCLLLLSARQARAGDSPDQTVAVPDAYVVGPGSLTDFPVVNNDIFNYNHTAIVINITQPDLFIFGSEDGSTTRFLSCSFISNACVRYKAPSLALMQGQTQIFDRFTYTLMDKVTNVTSTTTVNVTIVLPPVAVDDSFNVPNLRGTYNFSVLDNDSDPNSRQLRVANVIVPPGSGEIVVFIYGTSPANNATIIEVKLGGLPVVLTYVLDNGGVISYGNLTITGTAVPPPLMDDSAAALVGRPRYLRVLKNDVADGYYLNISSFTGPNLASLGASIDFVDECPLLVTDRWPLNCLAYNPPEKLPRGQNFAWDNFTYTAYDTANNMSSTATVSVKVVLEPVARDDVYYGAALNYSGNATVAFVLDNDFDPNNLPLYVVDVQLPKRSDANVTVIDEYSIKVELGTRPVTFKYTITNGLGNATASCTVTNRKQPVPPRTKDDSFIMTVGETRLLRVLDNDQGGGTGMVIADLTKSKLRRARAEAVNCWVGGVRSRSCVNYTAPLSPGEDMLIYTVRGANGLKMDAAMYVTVFPRPQANNDRFVITDRSERNLFLLGNDLDKAMLPFEITRLTCNASRNFDLFTNTENDGITFIPPLTGFKGTQMSCVYTITNKYGGRSTATATILFQADDATCPPKAGAGCSGEPARFCDPKRAVCEDLTAYLCVYRKGC